MGADGGHHKLEEFLLKNQKIHDGVLVKASHVKASHDLRATQRQLIVVG